MKCLEPASTLSIFICSDSSRWWARKCFKRHPQTLPSLLEAVTQILLGLCFLKSRFIGDCMFFLCGFSPGVPASFYNPGYLKTIASVNTNGSLLQRVVPDLRCIKITTKCKLIRSVMDQLSVLTSNLAWTLRKQPMDMYSHPEHWSARSDVNAAVIQMWTLGGKWGLTSSIVAECFCSTEPLIILCLCAGASYTLAWQ